MNSNEKVSKMDNQSNPAKIQTQDIRRVNFTEFFGFIHYAKNQANIQPIPEKLNDYWKEHQQSFREWLGYKGLSDRTKKGYYSSLIKLFKKHNVSNPKELRNILL